MFKIVYSSYILCERKAPAGYNICMHKLMKLFIASFFALYAVMPVSAVVSDEKKQEIKALYSANSLDKAYSLITKISEDERDYELWYILANISQDRGENLNAVFFLQKSINLNPDFDKAYYNLGNIYLSENRYNMALNEYRKALKRKKDCAYYHYNTGCAYLGLKDYKKAVSAFKKALFYKSDEPDFYYNLAFAYKNLNKEKQMNKALEKYNSLKDAAAEQQY